MTTIHKDIVIVGAGLTGLSLAYYLKNAGKNVLIVEQNSKVGGVIDTITEGEFTYETGPSTGVLGSVEIVQLFNELSAHCELQVADKSANKRYIWKKNRWHALPSGLISAVGTSLFTWYDKFRILGEPFRPKGGYPNEPISELVKRRLGNSFLDYAVDPFLSGVYAGDPKTLITRHALPKLYALEVQYGGFIRGTIAKRKEAKLNNLETSKPKVTREVFSLKGGLKSLVDTLATQVEHENIVLSCQNVKISPQIEGFKTTFNKADGSEFEIFSSLLISTVGGYQLPALLPFVAPHLIQHLADTTYAPVIHVALGYKNWTGIKLDAFGGLVASKENRKVLGVLFPSAIFANRAPKGGALLSVFMGGMKRKELLDLTDDALTKVILDELKITMKIENKPDLLRINRYQHAIAQYDIKSDLRFEAIAEIEKNFKGLILAGSIRDGIGMADRVKQAFGITQNIINN